MYGLAPGRMEDAPLSLLATPVCWCQADANILHCHSDRHSWCFGGGCGLLWSAAICLGKNRALQFLEPGISQCSCSLRTASCRALLILMHVYCWDVHAIFQWEALCAFLDYEVILAFLFPPQASRLFGDMREEGTTVRAYILLLKKAFLNGVVLLVLELAGRSTLWNRSMTDFMYY